MCSDLLLELYRIFLEAGAKEETPGRFLRPAEGAIADFRRISLKTRLEGGHGPSIIFPFHLDVVVTPDSSVANVEPALNA